MVQPTLGPLAGARGYRLLALDTVGSTNAEAMTEARAGDPGGLWVFSPEQTAGRGRRGRNWATVRGNMAATLLTVTDVDAAKAATLGFVAGLALSEALARLMPDLSVRMALDGADTVDAAGVGQGRLALKWPNDVILDGAKLSGILLEAEPAGDGRLAVVIGIGVNVVSAPAGLPYPATSLSALGVRVTAETLFRELAEAWVPVYDMWLEDNGLDRIRQLWLARADGLGAPAAVSIGKTVVRGRFETIDAEGRLILRDDDGVRHAIAAGEVHFGVAASARLEE